MIKHPKIQNKLSNIYFLNQSSDIADITAYAQENNIALFHIDGNRVISKEALLHKLKIAMHAPTSHEQGWGTFKSDITNLSWIAPSNGFFLVYENYVGLLQHHPEDWTIFLDILFEATEFWKQTETPLSIFFPNYKLKQDNEISLTDEAGSRQLASYISDIYFLNPNENMSEIVVFAQKNNIEYFHLDGRKITRKRDLLLQVGDTLRFPDYYGQNWDALNDCIRDIDSWIPSRNGYILFYEGFDKLLLSSPSDWIVFLEILLDAVEVYRRYEPPLYIFLKSSARKYSVAELPTGQHRISNKQEYDSVLANSEIFTQESYREFMVYINNLGERLKHLFAAMSHYPKDKRFESFESDEWEKIRKKYRQTPKIYRLRLPLHTIAICPYCRTSVVKPFDTFSLLGLYNHLSIDYTYVGRVDLDKDDIYLGRHCAHALFTMQFVNLNGREPDDLPVWAANHLFPPSSLRSAPHLLVWPLIARRTSAVIHELPIGRYDDLESQHHYTSYFVTYFADGNNSNIGSFWNRGDENAPTPALSGNIYKDYDLLKWVKVKRLLWIDPKNMKKIVNKPIAKFPYENIQPQGWYRIRENRSVDGPYPGDSKWIWSGKPPHHNQSFSRPIDM